MYTKASGTTEIRLKRSEKGGWTTEKYQGIPIFDNGDGSYVLPVTNDDWMFGNGEVFLNEHNRTNHYKKGPHDPWDHKKTVRCTREGVPVEDGDTIRERGRIEEGGSIGEGVSNGCQELLRSPLPVYDKALTGLSEKEQKSRDTFIERIRTTRKALLDTRKMEGWVPEEYFKSFPDTIAEISASLADLDEKLVASSSSKTGKESSKASTGSMRTVRFEKGA